MAQDQMVLRHQTRAQAPFGTDGDAEA
jgi:hypothetical protein